MTLFFPYLETKRIRLVPAAEQDARILYGLLLRLGMASLPTLDEFMKATAGGVAARFLVQRQDDGETVGYSSLHQMVPAAGHVEAGIYLDPEHIRSGLGAEASTLTLNYAFATWNVRKVYFQTTEASFDDFGPLLDVLTKEAVLPNHVFFRGRLWDVHIYAVYREEWEQTGETFVSRLALRRDP
ncbi:N-acetyltransferase [Actinomadura sp. KC06]|uniref:GNAT family N-acetyltransferase n=1 Tax=Actinomadura sp. KC06 TaxID=2530369 RepID=UPI00104C9886|nr:GNAT family protein [Actinomadura sp. KC06]TDD37563.1 N-acetyltransferase [Actinomadura sp. KC06]